MSRVDHQHGVEFEADFGAGLDVLHARDEEAREQFAIAEASLNAGRDFFEEPVAGRLLDEPHDGGDLGVEAERVRIERGLGGAHGREPGEKAEVADAGDRADCGAVLEERPARVAATHRYAPFRRVTLRSAEGS
jgi:hypothetical protein